MKPNFQKDVTSNKVRKKVESTVKRKDISRGEKEKREVKGGHL